MTPAGRNASATTATKTDPPRRSRRSRSRFPFASWFLFASCASWLIVFVAIVAIVAIVAAVAAQEPDRSKPPAVGPPPKLDLPAIQKKTLANGLSVWLIERHEVPLVQINLVIQAGANEDPQGKFGLASLTAAMLDEGAAKRSALEIADAIDFLGAVLTTTSSFDASAVRLNVPVARLQEALPILADVVLRPTFPQSDLDRVRKERLTSLLQARDDPQSIAPMAFSRIVFGPAHRFGTGAIGTESTIKGFTVDDLRTFHGTYYAPATSTLIVSGDVGANVLPLIEQQFGAWNTHAPRRTPIPPAPPLTSRQIYLVDKPGAEQSQIRIGSVGIARTTPDYFPLLVLNTILGGSFTSRLNQNLRETHGYTYGAFSTFDMRLAPGPFFAGAGVQTDKTAEALREFFKELEAIHEPIGREELTKAKNYIALGFPGEFETIGDLSRHTEELIVYTLRDDYFERYIPNVQTVAAHAVQQAAMKYIQPSKVAVVVVGDRKTIEAPIRALNLGPVRIMSVMEALPQ